MTSKIDQQATLNFTANSNGAPATHLFKRGLYVLAALGILAGASVAHARIIKKSNVRRLVNLNITEGNSEHNTKAQARKEKQCKTLQAPLGPLPAGAVVSSHIIHYDPINQPNTTTGSVTFDGEILWVITDSAMLDATDAQFGASAVTYPAAGVEPYRGLEPAQTPLDNVSISTDTIANDTIDFTMEVTGYVDQVRVITCCDDDDGLCD